MVTYLEMKVLLLANNYGKFSYNSSIKYKYECWWYNILLIIGKIRIMGDTIGSGKRGVSRRDACKVGSSLSHLILILRVSSHMKDGIRSWEISFQMRSLKSWLSCLSRRLVQMKERIIHRCFSSLTVMRRSLDRLQPLTRTARLQLSTMRWPSVTWPRHRNSSVKSENRSMPLWASINLHLGRTLVKKGVQVQRCR